LARSEKVNSDGLMDSERGNEANALAGMCESEAVCRMIGFII